jgi:uncharacterized protein YybS (DUF2232 family)
VSEETASSGMILRNALIGTVLTVVLHAAAGFLGPLGVLVYIFVPLPVAYIALSRGLTPATGAVLFSFLFLAVTGGFGSGFSYLLQFGIASLVLSLMLCMGRRWDAAVVAGVMTSLLTGAIALSLFGSFRGVSLGEMVRSYVQHEVDRAMNLYREAQLSPDQLQEMQRIVDHMAAFLITTWPALSVIVTGTVLLATVFFLTRFSKGQYQIAGPPFASWKVPEKLIWVLIIGGVGFLLGSGAMRVLALNLLTIVLPIYFLQGLAVVTWFFQKKNVTPFFRRLGYMLVLLLNPLPLLVTGVGIFDLWIDFRKSRDTEK